jgi:RES domain-containing protein
MILWRISNYADLSGRGGLVAPGRWHSLGTPVVYCCDHPSTALLEILVQIDVSQLPRDFQLLKITCPDDIAITDVDADDVDLNDINRTRMAGDRLLQDQTVCLIRVTSAIMPEARNVLINPSHPRAGEIVIEDVKRYPFDSRLLRA